MDTQTNQQLQIFIIKHKDGKKEHSKYLSHVVIFDDNSIISMFGRFFFLTSRFLFWWIESQAKENASLSLNLPMMQLFEDPREREKLFK